MDKRIIWFILFLLLLLLLWFLFVQPVETDAEAGWVNKGSPFQGKTKLHEEQGKSNSILWGDCCEGEIKVEFEYMWEFYDDEWSPPDDCCHNPVVWTVTDSLGVEVFKKNSYTPEDTFDDPVTITAGTWDCIHPWNVYVINGCLYPINYKWEATLFCYE